LRTWVRRAEVDAEVTSEQSAELTRLRRENAELRRANEMAVSSGQRNDLREFR
jgi:transposase